MIPKILLDHSSSFPMLSNFKNISAAFSKLSLGQPLLKRNFFFSKKEQKDPSHDLAYCKFTPEPKEELIQNKSYEKKFKFLQSSPVEFGRAVHEDL